jgi:O-antigen/teichoic acid export membrane protein
VLVVGKPLLMLFGPGFDAGYPLLFLLVVGVVARASVGPAESLLVMTGHQVACAVVFAITLCVAVALNALLIPLYGLWGAAAGMTAAMLFEATLSCLVIRAKLGFVMFVFWPAARGATA